MSSKKLRATADCFVRYVWNASLSNCRCRFVNSQLSKGYRRALCSGTGPASRYCMQISPCFIANLPSAFNLFCRISIGESNVGSHRFP